ncbi:putative ATP-dependent RNA helicase DDX28 [Gadus morhua]|uniref:putative ATP-dependent RNA helicase DDX28 n=1 Tax=Gadus morhua TaxID=8049 RepID=UPI0011B7AC9F|nr:probable ATP-dependent RNA helicase DDX28 [Gadus morhua]
MRSTKVIHVALVAHNALLLRNVSPFVNALHRFRDYGGNGPTRFGHSSAPTNETVVIRIPQHMQRRIENAKELRGKKKIPTIRAGKLLIQSKNTEHNQSAGYAFGKFEQTTLSSKGWKHNKSFGDYFIINNTKSVAPFITERQQEESVKEGKAIEFGQLHINKELVQTLNMANITHPTTVQLQTIPKVLKGNNILCAAETGSGKTLSYLLPIVHKLQLDKSSEDYIENTRTLGCLIVVPSRELAEQVASVSRFLCAPFHMLTKTVGGGRGIGPIKTVFRKGPADILVATPGALIKALRRRYLDLSTLSFLVVDEADTMFDPSFSGMLESILLQTNIARAPSETKGPGSKAQLLVVGATFPGGVAEVLAQVTDLGSMVTVKSKNLHLLMPHVKQTFLKVKGCDKLLELQQVLKELQHETRGEEVGAGVVVFCNKASTVNWLGYALDELRVKHLRLQGEMPSAVRTGIFRSFQKGTVDLLICTDIASRGLDTSRVRLVVNYDCPESHTDYIHRAGRVGRAGGVEEGEVLSFVTHPWDVELVQAIETSARRRSALPGMKSAISKPKAVVEESQE